MKVVVSPQARMHIAALAALGFAGTGAVTGHTLGGHLILEEIWPLAFSQRNFSRKYETLRQAWGNRLRGIFFANREVWRHQDMLEEVVVEIRGRTVRFFLCRWDPRSRKPVLEKLVEEE